MKCFDPFPRVEFGEVEDRWREGIKQMRKTILFWVYVGR